MTKSYLLREADSYDVVPAAALQNIFLPRPDSALPLIDPEAVVDEGKRAELLPESAVVSEKPESAPSDLNLEKGVAVDLVDPDSLNE